MTKPTQKRVYISCHHPVPANELADALTAAGHYICSTWHREPGPRPAWDDAVAWADKAAHNFLMISSADALVLIAGDEKYPGGKFIEAGFAFGVGIKVYVLGRVENGMLHRTAIGKAKDTAELIAKLAG